MPSSKLSNDVCLHLGGGGASRGISLEGADLFLDLANTANKLVPSRPSFKLNDTAKGSPILAKLNELPAKHKIPVIGIDWPDMNTPRFAPFYWDNIAAIIKEFALSLKKPDVHIVTGCAGGHGRTGTALAILAGKFSIWTKDAKVDVVSWLRSIYCENAIETEDQIRYIMMALNTNVPDKVLGSNAYRWPKPTGPSNVPEYQSALPNSTTNHTSGLLLQDAPYCGECGELIFPDDLNCPACQIRFHVRCTACESCFSSRPSACTICGSTKFVAI